MCSTICFYCGHTSSSRVVKGYSLTKRPLGQYLDCETRLHRGPPLLSSPRLMCNQHILTQLRGFGHVPMSPVKQLNPGNITGLIVTRAAKQRRMRICFISFRHLHRFGSLCFPAVLPSPGLRSLILSQSTGQGDTEVQSEGLSCRPCG